MDSEHPIDIITNATGIGPSTLSDFEDAGFTTADEIGTHSPEELANTVNGVGYSTAISLLKYLETQGLRDTTNRDEDLEKLVSLLERLFEFDKKDRDFGVYKLMNQNREEIESYIQEDLINTIETEVSTIQDTFEPTNTNQARNEVIDELGVDAWTSNNELTEEATQLIEEKTNGYSPQELENIRSDIYNHIYKFFNRYYETGDFITQRNISHGNRGSYSIPYDGSNTYFYWVTQDQYYAKTSEQFTNFRVSISNHTFQFNTVHLEHDIPEGEQIGNNTYLVLDEDSISVSDSEISVSFTRRPVTQQDVEHIEELSKGIQDKQNVLNRSFAEEISEQVRPQIRVDSNELVDKLDEYTTRNQNDFFIHKDINTFLETELEEYVKSEIVSYNPSSGTEGLSEIDMEKGRVVNEIAIDIIEFVSHIEEFKRKIFEKKKFVTDRTELHQLTGIPDEYYEDVLHNHSQLKEWEESYGIDVDSLTAELLEKQPYNQMVVDTSYFERDITTGEEPQNKLIKGDNYQALNFLQEKYEESVKCIYIDPPYNTGNANFAYKDNYKRPTWLSMIYDRFQVSRELLTEDGVIFVHIDIREVNRLRYIMESVFGEDNMVAEIVWEKKQSPQPNETHIGTTHSHILVFAKNKDMVGEIGRIDKDTSDYTNPDNDSRGPWRSVDITAPSGTGPSYEVKTPKGDIKKPSSGRSWSLSRENFEELKKDDRIWFGKTGSAMPRKKKFVSESDGKVCPTNWSYKDVGSNEDGKKRDLKPVFGDNMIDYEKYTPKPVDIVKRILNLSFSNESGTVLDFFAGSGTTAQAVQELNRERDEQVNYILVEMLDEAFDITEERVKRTAFSKEWKNGTPQVDESDTPLALSVEVLDLESYEDALDAVTFENDTQTNLGSFNPSTLQYTLEFDTKGSPVFVDTQQFSRPLEYSLNGTTTTRSIDLLTTFNYLLGLEEYTRTTRTIENVEYTFFEGSIEDSSVLVVWRHDVDSVDYDAEVEEICVDGFDRVYVNGDSLLDNSVLIERVFSQKMLDTNREL